MNPVPRLISLSLWFVLAVAFADDARAAPPVCRLGSDGGQVCGYACRLGSDGRVACADTENGVCAVGSDGRAACTELAFLDDEDRGRSADRPGCRVGSDGHVRCGYQCRVGADGRVGCARGPDGVCAVGSDGHVVCDDGPAFARSQRRRSRGPWGDHHARGPLPADGPRPECRLGSDGHQACGYACMLAIDGRAVCAAGPRDVCARDAFGQVACSDVGASSDGSRRPECRRGGDGRVACGFSCTPDGSGHVVCARSADDVCARDAFGTVTCSDVGRRRRGH